MHHRIPEHRGIYIDKIWTWSSRFEIALFQERQNCKGGSGQTLTIGRNLNHVVFDTRMNGRTEQYIVASGFDPVQGQRHFQPTGKVVDVPHGHYGDKTARTGGKLGAITVKTAWTVIEFVRSSVRIQSSPPHACRVADGFVVTGVSEVF